MSDPNELIADIIDSAPATIGGGSFSASAPQPPPWVRESSQSLAAAAADDDGQLDAAIRDCAALDHSDTDNGKRLRAYFAGDLLVMAEKDAQGGAALTWNGKIWDLANGAAGALMMAQRVGDFIAREADHLTATPYEHEAIEAAAAAKKQIAPLEALPFASLTDEQKAQIATLNGRIEAGEIARNALDARKKARRKFGISSKNAARVVSMLNMAAPHLRRDPHSFNADALKVACESHTLAFVRRPDPDCPDPDVVRLRWELDALPGHRRDDLITALVPVAYDPEAKAPHWQAFLDYFMPSPGQDDKRRTLQQYAGAGLLGIILQHVMFHYGEGSNGKSVFLETLLRLLGPSFAVSLPSESLVNTNMRTGGAATPDIMRLFGKRMLRVHELPKDKPLDESLVKQITGGEEITARALNKGYVDFVNRAKPHMSGNGFPRIDGTDHGIWRRMLVMHWTQTMPKEKRREFEAVVTELLTDAPGIFNWLIEGALDFLNYGGIYEAPEVAEATQDYRFEMDTTAQFAADCIEAAPGEEVTARTLYNAYVAYCAASAKTPVKETRFGRTMKTRYKRRDDRIRVYLDIRLHDVPEAPRNAGDGYPPPPEATDYAA